MISFETISSDRFNESWTWFDYQTFRANIIHEWRIDNVLHYGIHHEDVVLTLPMAKLAIELNQIKVCQWIMDNKNKFKTHPDHELIEYAIKREKRELLKEVFKIEYDEAKDTETDEKERDVR